MTKNIFRTVRELLDWPDNVLASNAVHMGGHLYNDSIANLTSLRRLERPLRELVDICVRAGIEWDSLGEVIELIGETNNIDDGED